MGVAGRSPRTARALPTSHSPARHPRAAHPRLQAQRHHLAVRGAGRRHRLGHRQVLPPPPGERAPRLPQGDRPKRPGPARHPHRHGQLRHPQDRGGQGPTGAAAALARPLHADIRLAAQPGRAPVRRVDAQAVAARRAPLDPTGRGRRPCLDRPAQPGPKTLHMDQVRRRHPRRRQTLLHPRRSRLMRRTLDSGD